MPTSRDRTSTLDATGRTGAPGKHALVLHGGGSAGNAWEIGIIGGLFDAGMDVTKADLTIGTSAGATAAAQITAAATADLLGAILTAPLPQRAGPARPEGPRAPIRPAVDPLERTNRIIAGASDAADRHHFRCEQETFRPAASLHFLAAA